jgi:hypothetical protein
MSAVSYFTQKCIVEALESSPKGLDVFEIMEAGCIFNRATVSKALRAIRNNEDGVHALVNCIKAPTQQNPNRRVYLLGDVSDQTEHQARMMKDMRQRGRTVTAQDNLARALLGYESKQTAVTARIPLAINP